MVPRPEIATVERRVAPSRSQRDAPRVANAVVAPRQRDRRPVRASRRSAHPSFGVGTKENNMIRAPTAARKRKVMRWREQGRKPGSTNSRTSSGPRASPGAAAQ